MKQRSMVESFNSAIEGFFYVIKTQKNMKFHFLAAVSILLIAIYLHIPLIQILILCGTISLVLIMEMINTALEHTIDMVMETFHPLARIIKDVMAGSVLLSAINAFIIGYLIFQKRLGLDLGVGVLKVRQSPWHMTFIAVIFVMAIVVTLKALFHKGTPLRGGMPSGHAAFVFVAWTIIVFLSANSLIIILTLIMAILVSRSRIQNQIHSIWEVVAGSALGILLTTLVFQLLKR
jgi:diacylglycerol kinase (ATP)